mgnify:FL=1
MEFDKFENEGTSFREIYDTTEWSERRLIQFVNYNVNKRTAILEWYLIFISVLLLIVLLVK